MANRYRIYQKGKYYAINDDISKVAIISCIRTKIEAEILCDLVNSKEEKIKELKDSIDTLEDDNRRYSLGFEEIIPEKSRFKITGCSNEIQDTSNNHFYWLELDENVTEICRILNEFNNELEPFYNLAKDYNINLDKLPEAFEDLLEENINLTSQIKKYETTLISSIQSERTSLGGNVLKNLACNLDIEY